MPKSSRFAAIAWPGVSSAWRKARCLGGSTASFLFGPNVRGTLDDIRPLVKAYKDAILEQLPKKMRTKENKAEIEGSRVAIHHRVGRLEVGETAVVIAASAPHRAEAFAACREAIEALKRDVPIWKREIADDGAVWIGQGP